jgi:uncharacterized protein
MAFWDRISSRGRVEDRRGTRTAILGGGGISLTGLALLLILNYLGGGDVGDVLGQLQNVDVAPQQLNTAEFEGADSYEVFASTVLGSTNDMWSDVFAKNNRTYTPPKLVLFRTATPSECGYADSQVGPHYCPNDRTIYLDETFFNELKNRFGAQGGDVAEAYVIAHEVGHHVQNELGVLATEGTSEDSVRLELQADCLAGLWAHSVSQAGIFEPGEIREALDAVAAVGDDRIQEAVTGRINPESWTHGSSEQRLAAFNDGFESGSVSNCEI